MAEIHWSEFFEGFLYHFLRNFQIQLQCTVALGYPALIYPEPQIEK